MADLAPLTLEYAIENKFTPIDCVKYFEPEWEDGECDYYLWERTCFPLDMQKTIQQLNEALLKNNKNNR